MSAVARPLSCSDATTAASKRRGHKSENRSPGMTILSMSPDVSLPLQKLPSALACKPSAASSFVQPYMRLISSMIVWRTTCDPAYTSCTSVHFSALHCNCIASNHSALHCNCIASNRHAKISTYWESSIAVWYWPGAKRGRGHTVANNCRCRSQTRVTTLQVRKAAVSNLARDALC